MGMRDPENAGKGKNKDRDNRSGPSDKEPQRGQDYLGPDDHVMTDEDRLRRVFKYGGVVNPAFSLLGVVPSAVNAINKALGYDPNDPKNKEAYDKYTADKEKEQNEKSDTATGRERAPKPIPSVTSTGSTKPVLGVTTSQTPAFPTMPNYIPGMLGSATVKRKKLGGDVSKMV